MSFGIDPPILTAKETNILLESMDIYTDLENHLKRPEFNFSKNYIREKLIIKLLKFYNDLLGQITYLPIHQLTSEDYSKTKIETKNIFDLIKDIYSKGICRISGKDLFTTEVIEKLSDIRYDFKGFIHNTGEKSFRETENTFFSQVLTNLNVSDSIKVLNLVKPWKDKIQGELDKNKLMEKILYSKVINYIFEKIKERNYISYLNSIEYSAEIFLFLNNFWKDKKTEFIQLIPSFKYEQLFSIFKFLMRKSDEFKTSFSTFTNSNPVFEEECKEVFIKMWNQLVKIKPQFRFLSSFRK